MNMLFKAIYLDVYQSSTSAELIEAVNWNSAINLCTNRGDKVLFKLEVVGHAGEVQDCAYTAPEERHT